MSRQITLSPIQTGVTKTPDFEVYLSDQAIAVEVKELCPNDEDVYIWEEFSRRGAAAGYCGTDDRIRGKILTACKQLKPRTKKKSPALLVLFDNGTFGGIDSTDIKNAMYGNETWTVTELADCTEVRPRLGGGRMCTANANTTLSAIVVLRDSCVAFHNVFAACPIPGDFLKVLCDRQFSINLNVVDKLPVWEEI